jgi:hypothetical protein
MEVRMFVRKPFQDVEDGCGATLTMKKRKYGAIARMGGWWPRIVSNSGHWFILY